MTNNQLAKEYKESLRLLTGRISILKIKLKEMEQDRNTSKSDIRELRQRLKPLMAMQRDLREISKEVKNYYVRSWWRSERYTCNSRKARRFIPYIRNIFEASMLDKLEPDPEDEESTL